MKIFSAVILAGATLLAGCASGPEGAKNTVAKDEESYVPLGSLIARKGPSRSERNTIDLQALENDRTMNNGVNNGPQGNH